MFPSLIPSDHLSVKPSKIPSMYSTFLPSLNPSLQPSLAPTWNPSGIPSLQISELSSMQPSNVLSLYPSTMPSSFHQCPQVIGIDATIETSFHVTQYLTIFTSIDTTNFDSYSSFIIYTFEAT